MKEQENDKTSLSKVMRSHREGTRFGFRQLSRQDEKQCLEAEIITLPSLTVRTPSS